MNVYVILGLGLGFSVELRIRFRCGMVWYMVHIRVSGWKLAWHQDVCASFTWLFVFPSWLLCAFISVSIHLCTRECVYVFVKP